MSAAAALLDRLGRPGAVRLGGSALDHPARLATALPALDDVLGGGLPRGRLTELVGPRSAGRTGLACRIVAGATRQGETVAWVDLEDALDPDALRSAGVTLPRLLWVRPRTTGDALHAAEVLLGAGGFGLIVLDLGMQPAPAERGSARRDRLPGRSIWTRLAHVAERTRSTLLVLALARQAGACATLELELASHRARWSGGPGRRTLLDGVIASLTVARHRGAGTGRSVVLRQACA